MKHTIWILAAAAGLLCSCGGNGGSSVAVDGGGAARGFTEVRVAMGMPPADGELTEPQTHNGRELFYADSLNAYYICRPYPVPVCTYTPVPKGYKPVYISSYARHGQRKLHRRDYCRDTRATLAHADSLGCLTTLGKEVLAKVAAIDDDIRNSVGDLTSVGAEQHRGIAERMWRNARNVFRHDAEIRLYSTVVQRTMMSMFACNERLLQLSPKLKVTRAASNSLSHLVGEFNDPYRVDSDDLVDAFLTRNFDPQPALDKLFSDEVPFIPNINIFIRHLYICGSIMAGLDIAETTYLWDLFTYDELYVLQWAESYSLYVRDSNSARLGDSHLTAMKPLLKDFMDKADAALAKEVPGADLRFGHDDYLIAFSALLGINGYVKVEEDMQKALDVFQDFIAAPMAGNIQMVFYRNRSGDVLVKFLQNEVESWIPISTDSWPYYRWDDVHKYFETLYGN